MGVIHIEVTIIAHEGSCERVVRAEVAVEGKPVPFVMEGPGQPVGVIEVVVEVKIKKYATISSRYSMAQPVKA